MRTWIKIVKMKKIKDKEEKDREKGQVTDEGETNTGGEE